jgi:hypothetical protein
MGTLIICGEAFWVISSAILYNKCSKLYSSMTPFPLYRSQIKSRLPFRAPCPDMPDPYDQCVNLNKIDPLAAELVIDYWVTGIHFIRDDATLQKATIVGTITNTRTYPQTAAERRPMTMTEKFLLVADMVVVARLLGDSVFAQVLLSEFQSNLKYLPSLDFLQLIKTFYNRHYNVQSYAVFRCALARFAWHRKYHTYWHTDSRKMAKLTHEIPEFDFLLMHFEKQGTMLDPISYA